MDLPRQPLGYLSGFGRSQRIPAACKLHGVVEGSLGVFPEYQFVGPPPDGLQVRFLARGYHQHFILRQMPRLNRFAERHPIKLFAVDALVVHVIAVGVIAFG